MKSKWLIMVAAAAAVCGVAGVAQAIPISGNITFVGGVILNSSSAATATEVVSWTGFGGTGSPYVESADGSFTGIPAGTEATFSPGWFFDSTGMPGLWSVGGFTFDLTSSHIVYQATTTEGGVPIGAAVVEGVGAVSGNDETPEAMTWSFSINDPGASTQAGLVFSFQVADGTVTSVPTVPDGGTTAMMLGLGILGLGLIKKQMLA